MAEGDKVCVQLTLNVDAKDGVKVVENVADNVKDALAVHALEAVMVGVLEKVRDGLLLCRIDEVGDREALGEADGVTEGLGDLEGLTEGEAVGLPPIVSVGDTDGDCVALQLEVADGVPMEDRLREKDLVRLKDRLRVPVGLSDVVSDWVVLCFPVRVNVPEIVVVGRKVPERVSVSDSTMEGEGLAVTVRVVVLEELCDKLASQVCEGDEV